MIITLDQFIKYFNIKKVVIVENDIDLIKDINTIICKLLLVDFNKLERLKFTIEEELFQKLAAFKKEIEVNEGSEFYKELEADAIDTSSFNEIGKEKEYNGIYEIIKDNTESISLAFLRIGIAIFSTESGFKEIIEILNKTIVDLIILNSLESVDIEYVKKELDSMPEKAKYISIVDKIVGTKDAGIKFIYDYLIPFNKENSFQMYSVIFSSSASQTQLAELNNIYAYEVSKEDIDYLSQIINVFLFCIYTYIFETINRNLNNASNQSFEIALKNPQNILNIIEKSKIEGITSFEAISNWFEIATKYYFNKHVYEDLKDLTYSLNTVNQNEIRHLKLNHNITDEILNMKISEIYDKTINIKFLPISNGDILQIDNRLYLLLGQTCDISLRDDTRRNVEIAELIELEVIESSKYEKEVIHGKKVMLDYSDGIESISIMHFNDIDKHIRIKLSEKLVFRTDFRILDLCRLDPEGNAKIYLNKNPYEISKYPLTEGNLEYYEEIKKKCYTIIYYKERMGINQFHIPLDKSLLDVKRDDQSFVFNVSRIIRLKKPFLTLIHNKFVERKRRTGLNTIDFAPFQPIKKTIHYCYPNNILKKFSHVFKNSSEFKLSNKILTQNIDDEFTDYIKNFLPPEIEFKNEQKQEYTIEKNVEGYILRIPYYNELNKRPFKKEMISFNRLFFVKEIKNKKIKFLDDASEIDLPKEGIDIYNQLSRGVYFYENGKSIIYKNGYIREMNGKK